MMNAVETLQEVCEKIIFNRNIKMKHDFICIQQKLHLIVNMRQ